MSFMHEVFVPNLGTLFAIKYHIQKPRLVGKGEDNSDSSSYATMPGHLQTNFHRREDLGWGYRCTIGHNQNSWRIDKACKVLLCRSFSGEKLSIQVVC